MAKVGAADPAGLAVVVWRDEAEVASHLQADRPVRPTMTKDRADRLPQE